MNIDGEIKNKMMKNQVLHEFRKNAAEKIIVELSTFHGNDVLNIWVYYNAGISEEDWKPSKKGVSMQTQLIPELKKAVDKAHEEYQGVN